MENKEQKYYTINGNSNYDYNAINPIYMGPAPKLTTPPNFTPDNNIWQPKDIPDYPYPGFTPNDIPDANFCWHRLPCGICKLTNLPCPKAQAQQPTITWTTNKIEDPKPDLENHSVCKK